MRAYSHLSEDERDQIAVLRAAGRSLGAIVAISGAPKAQFQGNWNAMRLGSGGYSPLHAAGANIWRRRRAAILEKNADLQTFVVDRLAEVWPPDQIAGWLRRGAECGLRTIGCETICAFVHRAAQKVAELWRYLARRRKRGRPLRARPAWDAIKDRASVDE